MSDQHDRNRDTDPAPAREESPEEEDLKIAWELLRGTNVPDPVPTFTGQNPGDFILGTHTGRTILRITPQGRVQLGPDVDLDEASELFWTNLALKRKGMEERLMHLGIMEAILLQMAESDFAYERAQLRAQQATATEHDRMMAEMARRSLESRVHGVLEFARGLRRRPDAPTPEELSVLPEEPEPTPG